MGMDRTAEAAPGRQAAYVARNRRALVKAGQEILAEIGLGATIEQIATHAQVSPTTVYKYFASKEVLFIEAFVNLFDEWIEWSSQTTSAGEPLELALDAGRKIFRVRQHNPFAADVLRNVWQDPQFVISVVGEDAEIPFFELAKNGAVNGEDFKERMMLWRIIFTGIITSLYVTEEISVDEADTAFGVALSIWGISEDRAKKLASRVLTFPTAN